MHGANYKIIDNMPILQVIEFKQFGTQSLGACAGECFSLFFQQQNTGKNGLVQEGRRAGFGRGKAPVNKI
jgi:hypothetical protein